MNVFTPIVKSLGINWKIFLAQLINFGIVFFVLKKFAFSPMQKMLKERKSKIDKGLNDAKKLESELEMARENYREKIQRAKQEANQIIAEAQKEHNAIIQKATEESQKKIDQSIEKAKKEIQEREEEMMAEIKKDAVELSMIGVSNFLDANLDTKGNRSFIEKIIKEKA